MDGRTGGGPSAPVATAATAAAWSATLPRAIFPCTRHRYLNKTQQDWAIKSNLFDCNFKTQSVPHFVMYFYLGGFVFLAHVLRPPAAALLRASNKFRLISPILYFNFRNCALKNWDITPDKNTESFSAHLTISITSIQPLTVTAHLFIRWKLSKLIVQ